MAPTFDEVAQVTAEHCNILLPARGPYERQLLLDHVVHLVHLNRSVRVNVDGCAWFVSQPVDGRCANCGRPLGQIAAKISPAAAPLCGDCAFARHDNRCAPQRRWRARRPAAHAVAAPRPKARPLSGGV